MEFGGTGVDKGAQAPPIAGQKFFQLKQMDFQASLQLNPVVHVTITQREGGHFYQMPNVYTCIAYLIEIRKFCSKNLVHKGVDFEAQNALKLTYEHL